MSEPRRLSDFRGKWNLKREITARDGANASFEGTAFWVPANGGSNYAEHGHLTLENQTPLHAERRYHWAEDLSVYFEDGRFFHQVPPEGGEATHWCDPDTYIVTYDFSNWPAFRVVWKVSGPRKDYSSVTNYTRC